MAINNIRRKSVDLPELNQVSLDRAFEIYKERFSDASGFTFVLVGKCDVEKIKPNAGTLPWGLPAAGCKETGRDQLKSALIPI